MTRNNDFTTLPGTPLTKNIHFWIPLDQNKKIDKYERSVYLLKYVRYITKSILVNKEEEEKKKKTEL